MGCSHRISHLSTVVRPEEHLIGMLGRHHLFSGYRTYRKALYQISSDVTKQHPSAIDRPLYWDIYNQFGCGETYSDFLKEHTLFGVYEPFISNEIVINGQKMLQPYLINKHRYANEWRFCTSCVQEDVENEAMPFFRLEHQLPTMSVCYKHSKRLHLFCSLCHTRDRLIDRIGYPFGLLCRYCNEELAETNSFIDDDVIWLHQTMIRLMNGQVSLPSLEQLKRTYQNQLGLCEYGNGFSVKQRGITKAAQKELDNYFDPRLYSALFTNCDKEGSAKRTPSLYLYRVLFKDDMVFSPVVHLLIIRMLFGDIDNIPQMN